MSCVKTGPAIAVALCCALAGAAGAEPPEEVAEPPEEALIPGEHVPWERSFLGHNFPVRLEDDLHPALHDRVWLIFVLNALFFEMGAGVWAPAITAGPVPEGYWGDALVGAALHMTAALCCLPCLGPVMAFWVAPVFAINTYSRYLWLRDRRLTREGEEPPPAPLEDASPEEDPPSGERLPF